MGTFIYFAYGSNMLTERLRARCPSATPVSVAYAPNHRLEFSKLSSDKSGKATLTSSRVSHQYGVIFEIDHNELNALDRAEGRGHGYGRDDGFRVIHADTKHQVDAVTYLATQLSPDLKPYDWYVALVVAGAIQHRLPQEQIEHLRSVPHDIVDRNQNAIDGRREATSVLRQAGFGSSTDVLSTPSNVSDVTGLAERIIKELTRLETVPMSERSKEDDFSLPRMIDAGNGGSLIVSRQLDEDIERVARKLMDDDPTLKPRFTQAEWRAMVRRTFGPALASIDLDDDVTANASTVLDRVKTSLARGVTGNDLREFAFGCTLFGNGQVQPFSIGPVRFEAREDWLARKHREGGISTASRARVERAWQGQKLRKRKPSFDSISETDVLDAVDSCRFVSSVTTKGLAPEAGRDKALTAARLATTAIALTWQTPSKALDGINLLFDRRPHRQKALTFTLGHRVLAGASWSNHPFGPSLKAGQWENILSERADIFAVVGDVLDYIVSPTGAVARPKMMSALAHALLWFHEGCRETVTHMAIVNFSAALDALACGGKAGGIRRLVNARLKIQDNQPIRQDGPTLKKSIDRIYSDGRSRTIHGTNDELGYDWSTRGLSPSSLPDCAFCSASTG